MSLSQNALLILAKKMQQLMSTLEEKLMNIEIPPNKYNNLTREERSTLYKLKNDRNIVIKRADKNSAIVVGIGMVCDDPGPLISTIHETIEKIQKRDELNADTIKFFLVKNPTFACFYLLRKIHNRLHDVPGRPVTSNCSYYNENVSSLLTFICNL